MTTVTTKSSQCDKLYPAPFTEQQLSEMAENSFNALMDYLKKTKAPKDVQRLLDTFYCLTLQELWMAENGGDQATEFNAQFMGELAGDSRTLINSLKK